MSDDRISQQSDVGRHYEVPEDDSRTPQRSRAATEAEQKPKESVPLPQHPSAQYQPRCSHDSQMAFDFSLRQGAVVAGTRLDMHDRDPRLQNQELKTTFLEVFAEPGPEQHSIACVWTLSFRTFDITRIYFYKILTLIFALPIAFFTGLSFGLYSFLLIWLIKPSLRLTRMILHQILFVWPMFLMYLVRPCCYSMGAFWSTFRVHQSTGPIVEEPWMVHVEYPPVQQL